MTAFVKRRWSGACIKKTCVRRLAFIRRENIRTKEVQVLLHHIGAGEWRKLAATVKIDAEAVISRLRNMAAQIPDLLADEVSRAQQEGLTNPVIGRLQTRLSARAAMLAAF